MAPDFMHPKLLLALHAFEQNLITKDQLLLVFSHWKNSPGQSIAALIAVHTGVRLPDNPEELFSDTLPYNSSPSDSGEVEDQSSTLQYKSIDEDLYQQLKILAHEQPELIKAIDSARHEVETRSYLTSPAHPRLKTVESSIPKTIDHYKLLQKLGEGGMGTVWMAEQEKPVRRLVALKVIKAGLGDTQMVARFEAERQALAMMDHVNIARVYDAGTTSAGQPYFVMELVRGVPLTDYCDNNRLGLEERLQLFVMVCRAIQHAHQKGIIHRDLKPSNVLVGISDGKPVPKVIDFGLAKALQHQTRLSERTMFTEFGQVVGTLRYMSPEQAEMSAQDVDTRTDIYSLGVILYELLTGSTPIEKALVDNEPIMKVLEAIRSKDPSRPSVRLGNTSIHAISEIGERRQIEPKKLQRILRGELDWIVMKSIEKDRSRRYESAGVFAEDVERYLSGNAVLARPPSGTYQLQKFVRRNRTAVITTFLSLLFGCLSIAGIAWFAIDANLQRRLANEASRSAEESAEQRKREEVLRREAETQANIAVASEQKARISEKMAMQARKSAEEARRMAEMAKEESLAALRVAEEAAFKEQDARKAEQMAQKDSENSKQQAVESREMATRNQQEYEQKLIQQQARFKETLASIFLDPIPDSSNAESIQKNFAKRMYLASLKLNELSIPETGTTEGQLWLGILNLGFPKEFNKVLSDSVAKRRKATPNQPSEFAQWCEEAASMLVQGNQGASAEPLLRECLTIRAAIPLQEYPWKQHRTELFLGQCLVSQKKFEEGEKVLLAAYQGLQSQEKSLPNDFLPYVEQARESLAEVYRATNRPAEAEALIGSQK